MQQWLDLPIVVLKIPQPNSRSWLSSSESSSRVACASFSPCARRYLTVLFLPTYIVETFMCIGNFEALSPPSNSFFLSSSQQDADYEALQQLSEWIEESAFVRCCKTKCMDAHGGWWHMIEMKLEASGTRSTSLLDKQWLLGELEGP